MVRGSELGYTECSLFVSKAKEDDEVDDQEEESSLPHNETVSGPSLVSLSLSVGKGLISLNLPVKVGTVISTSAQHSMCIID